MLVIGDKAPLFSLSDQDGNIHNLKDYISKKVILYFYPKDDTPGCTKEAIEFSQMKDKFDTLNTVILGVSRDSISKHKSFCDKHNLSITLLSDNDPFVTDSYGVWQEKKNYGRTYMGIVRSTFLINEKGLIDNIWSNVRVKGHVEAILKEISS